MTDRSRYYASLEAEVPKPVERRKRRTKADLVKLGLGPPVVEDDGEAPLDSDITHRRMNELRCNELLYLLKKYHGGSADGT
jgi:hypothetical protein